MSPSEIVSLAASAGNLALALLCVGRASKSRLALPLALLCLVIFGWTSAELAHDLTGDPGWSIADHVLSPFTSPFALSFVLLFTGRRRALRTPLALSFVAAGLLGAASVGTLFVADGASFFGSAAWAIGLLATSLPPMIFAVAILALHLRAAHDPTERARTALVLAAFLLGTLFGITEALSDLAPPFPSLGNLGMLAATPPIAIIALRFQLFERDVSLRAASWVTAGAGVVTVLVLAIHRYLDARAGMALFGAAIVTIALLAITFRFAKESAMKRAKASELVTLGRFSAQMAHDIKNPLAALKGAAQLLQVDLAQAEPGIDRAAFVGLVLQQIERLEGLVEVYGRLARLELVREPLALNELAEEVVGLARLANDKLTFVADLAGDVPRCHADREMLTRVLENLVRNAVEATPEGGTITVSTRRADDRTVVVAVADTGAGMDARTRERAFDEFFTTKAQGSGLGLSFVRRVAEAHGGNAAIAPREERGTVVSIRLSLGVAAE